MVDANELKIISEIFQDGGLTQRELAQKTKLSLGAVNLIIKRLVTRGIVKTKALSPKKMEYMLTPKGFAQKAQKSYNYILKTVDLVKMVRAEIAKIILEEYNKGQKSFAILGHDDLADIIELALKGFDYQRVDSVREIKDDKVLVLLGRTTARTNGFRVINLAERLQNSYWGVI